MAQAKIKVDARVAAAAVRAAHAQLTRSVLENGWLEQGEDFTRGALYGLEVAAGALEDEG